MARNPKNVRMILLVIFFLSSGLGLVLSLIRPYQIFTAAELSRAQSEAAKFDNPDVRGFGILGDSNSDEYRADNERGGPEYGDTTLNWMEQLVLKRGLNFGPWGTWGEPRRTGYKYNWARSGATTRSMIDSGQHTGLAQQVANGEVSHVMIWIGANDFTFWNHTYDDIYWGKLTEAEIQAKVEAMIANITLAVDTLLQAGAVKIVIVTVPDPGTGFDEQTAFPDPTKRQRVSEVIAQVDAGIAALAKDRHLKVVDLTKVASELLSRLDEDGSIIVGDIPLNFMVKSNSPYHMRLDDKPGHPGTVASGLIANLTFIRAFNESYGLNITPFTDEEILASAGIAPTPKPPNYWGLALLCTALVSAFGLANQSY